MRRGGTFLPADTCQVLQDALQPGKLWGLSSLIVDLMAVKLISSIFNWLSLSRDRIHVLIEHSVLPGVVCWLVVPRDTHAWTLGLGALPGWLKGSCRCVSSADSEVVRKS